MLFRRLEPWSFLLLVALHAAPIVVEPLFPTLDGPSHLNNARLLRDLWLGHGRAAEFFAINPFPEPNLLGDLIMAIAMIVAPAALAEKLVLLLAVAGLAYTFRTWVRQADPERPWASFLVLPFLLSVPLFMGFINFCLSLPLMFLILAEWERSIAGATKRGSWRMGVMLLLLYTAHLSTFLLTASILVARTVQANRSPSGTAPWRALALALALPIGLSATYFLLHAGHAAKPARFPVAELLAWMRDGRAWTAFAPEAEVPWTRPIAIVLLGLGAAALPLAVKSGPRSLPAFLAVVTMGLAGLFLLLPDTMAGGSLMTPRLLLFTMLFLTAFSIAARIDGRVLAAGTAVVGICSIGHWNTQRGIHHGLCTELAELMEVAPAVPEGAVLLPLNYGDNWLHSNFSSYLGAVRGTIVLDNFVATAPFSPVRWRKERMPYAAIGDFDRSERPCVRIDNYRAGGLPLVDLVLTWKRSETMADSCTNDARGQLAGAFREVAASGGHGAVLYERTRAIPD